MTDNVDYKARGVQAVFGGISVWFQARNEKSALESLESAIGSPLAAYNRFRAGAWRSNDIRHVLAHAYPGASLVFGMTRVAAVDAAIAARPIATYAVLASKILEGLLFGLDPAAAWFDEARPF